MGDNSGALIEIGPNPDNIKQMEIEYDVPSLVVGTTGGSSSNGSGRVLFDVSVQNFLSAGLGLPESHENFELEHPRTISRGGCHVLV